MNKAFVAIVAAFLLTLTASARQHKGVGCWRTAPARQLSAPTMKGRQLKNTNYHGEKRGLVILAEFPDTEFKSSNNLEKYKNILNKPGYATSEGFRASVADYFRDQSGGLFELKFDVVGPYTAAQNVKYYGENDKDGYDLRPAELIREMCILADREVNFSDYDWDGDGEVDEVFVVYAGKGEADSGILTTIWPHMWTLREATGKALKLDNVMVNVYACANELAGNGKINGIGTFCHEFSHCLGLPDFYDTYHAKLFGMDDFDIMSGGNYAGNTFCPVGYTAYEKMACGWQQPIVLDREDVVVDSLMPMSKQGDFYIIYNDAYPDEYYMIENRQQTGWDAFYPSRGLLITHVDYDAEVWANNIPNSIVTSEEAKKYELTCSNDHERMTFFHADNKAGIYDIKNDLYPYGKHDSLTATSMPAATLYHNNSAGTKLMQGAILDIRQNSGGTVGFRYRAPQQDVDAVSQIAADSHKPSKVYTIDGRVAGDLESLPRGIYIVNGRKIVR